jgi:hypothetical protein
MSFWDAVELMIMPVPKLVAEGARGLFGDHHHGDGASGPATQERLSQILGGPSPLGPGIGAPPPSPPPVPGGSSGLAQGADEAGGAYQRAGGAVAVTDEKLADLVKQIFASNDEVRTKMSGIINEIETAHQKLAADPQLANDPHALTWFQQWVDGKLGEIQTLLNNAKGDSKMQAELLAALADEYRNTTGDQHSKNGAGNGGQEANNNSDRGGGASSGGGTGGGVDPGAGGGGTGGGAADPGGAVTDPLAGMGGLPLGAAMGDPLSSMLGPALAGLGGIPGALGGAGASLPMDALGGLAPLASGLAGHGGDGFSDGGPQDQGKHDDFNDDVHTKSADDKAKAAENADTSENKPAPPSTPASAPSAPAQQPAPAAAVPASAGGDPSRVVPMPDGSPVTATSAQHAAAVRAVVNGSSVTDAWKQANVELPPPGTPVTAPADPSHLVPGQVAQFKTRDPVMYMGNGKVWLDGQLQSQTAMPTADFLGWFDPTQQAGAAVAPAAPAAPAPPSPPGAATTGT